MDNVFNKGYAAESAHIQASSSWYIPHYGVYNPDGWYLAVAVSFKGEG